MESYGNPLLHFVSKKRGGFSRKVPKMEESSPVKKLYGYTLKMRESPFSKTAEEKVPESIFYRYPPEN